MKFSDLLAFAKAGYSAADVKELLSINTDDSSNDDSDTCINSSDGSETCHIDTPTGDTTEEEQNTPTAPDVAPDPRDDEIAKLKEQVKNLQKQILNKDLSEGMETDEDKIKKLAEVFL